MTSDPPLDAACERAGLRTVGARLLHRRANAVYHLPAEDVLVRLRHTRGSGDWERRLASATRVTNWLYGRGYPTVIPFYLDPICVSGWVATFWKYVPAMPEAPLADTADLASLVRRLHEEPNPPISLARTNPLGSLRDDLEGFSTGLTGEQREWLVAESDRIVEEYDSASIPLGIGLIHGDAYVGNLFPVGRGYLVGDWDSVSIGPRVQDFVPTIGGVQHFNRPYSDWSGFCSVYGIDPLIKEDPGVRLLLRARELRSLAAYIRSAERPEIQAELDKRLRTLMFDEPLVWRAV